MVDPQTPDERGRLLAQLSALGGIQRASSIASPTEPGSNTAPDSPVDGVELNPGAGYTSLPPSRKSGGTEAETSSGDLDDRPPAPGDAAYEQAREIVLAKLTRRAYSRAELVDALAAKGIPAAVTDALLDHYEQIGLVNDSEFAAGWVESRHFQRHRSKRVVQRELRAKGIPDEISATALSRIANEDELSAARAVAQERHRSLRGLDRQTAYRRLTGALARRGFANSVVYQVVREYLSDWPTGVDPEIS